MTPRQADILRVLAAANGQPLSGGEIARRLGGSSGRAIHVHICNLRAAGNDSIVTLGKARASLGYVLRNDLATPDRAKMVATVADAIHEYQAEGGSTATDLARGAVTAILALHPTLGATHPRHLPVETCSVQHARKVAP